MELPEVLLGEGQCKDADARLVLVVKCPAASGSILDLHECTPRLDGFA